MKLNDDIVTWVKNVFWKLIYFEIQGGFSLKVAIVAPEGLPIPPLRGGSVQIYIDSLSHAFQQIGFQDYEIIAPGKKLEGIKLSLDCDAYRKQTLRILQQVQPDWIQIENRPLLIPLIRHKFPNSKILLNLHSTTFLQPRHKSQAEMKDILCNADHVIVNSLYLKETIAKRFELKEKNWQANVIYPGVNLEKFFPRMENDALFSSVSRNPHTLRLLFVGRIIRQKGLHVLLQALHILGSYNLPIQLTVAGRTPPWEKKYGREIEALAENLPVQKLGFVSPSQLPVLYRETDIFVCPSQQDEAFGMVNLEAMSSGLPVIASRIGGIPELVTEETGILIDKPQYPEEFVSAIQLLYNHPRLRQTLSHSARVRAEQFSWIQTATHFYSLYVQSGM